MNRNILFAGVLALLSTSTVLAQNATEKNVLLLGTQDMSVDYRDTTVYVPVLTNQELEIKAAPDWVTPSITGNKLKLVVQSNMNPEDRSGVISVATKNGAECFGLNAGVVEEGKLADFLLLDANDIQLLPDYNLISNLVYSADKNCITDVVCDGNFLMKNRRIKDEKVIVNNFKKISKKFRK